LKKERGEKKLGRDFAGGKKGVSAVIGVILTVAATIVIAAVLLAMLGAFTPPQPPHSILVTAKHINSTHIEVIFMGGPDSDLVNGLNLSVDASPINLSSFPDFQNGIVGNPVITDASRKVDAGPNNDAVVVTASFKDGTKQVVLNVLV
jgi:flagellin-like protein